MGTKLIKGNNKSSWHKKSIVKFLLKAVVFLEADVLCSHLMSLGYWNGGGGGGYKGFLWSVLELIPLKQGGMMWSRESPVTETLVEGL